MTTTTGATVRWIASSTSASIDASMNGMNQWNACVNTSALIDARTLRDAQETNRRRARRLVRRHRGRRRHLHRVRRHRETSGARAGGKVDEERLTRTGAVAAAISLATRSSDDDDVFRVDGSGRATPDGGSRWAFVAARGGARVFFFIGVGGEKGVRRRRRVRWRFDGVSPFGASERRRGERGRDADG